MRVKDGKHPLPPGPRGLPFIGTIKFPRGHHWETYLRWGRKYDPDVIHLTALGNDIIILNIYESAVELLDKRSSIYSDRPATTFTMLCGMGWLFAFVRYGQEWRDGRKAFQREFRPSVVEKYRPRETWEVTKLLRRLLATPEKYHMHIDTAIGSLALSIAYVIEVQEEDDPFLAAAQTSMHVVNTALVPGKYLVDFFPLLKYIPQWFPGAGFKRQAQVWNKVMTFCLHGGWDLVKARISAAQGTPDCAAKSLYEGMVQPADDPVYMEGVVRGAVATIYVAPKLCISLAGADTTNGVLMSFFLAMVLYPDEQRRAQSSIDRICQNRLPDFSDSESLPYIHAIVKEVLRWYPVARINVPHRCTQDDVYRQYLIPKGSSVIANQWAMLHDPLRYSDPETFKPHRFLERIGPNDADLILDPNVFPPERIIFGFGRRACPGRSMAYDTLWIAIARTLATFDIDKALDDYGQPITPSGECKSTFIVAPVPFPCKITPRSPAHEELIRKAANQIPSFV